MKINKMFGILGIILFLSASIIAVEVLVKEREVSKEDFDTATSKEIDTYFRNDTFGENLFYRNLISKSNYKLPTSPNFNSYKIVCTSWKETVFLTNGSLLTNIHPTEESYFINIIPIENILVFKMACLNEISVNKILSEKRIELDNWEVKAMNLILKNIEKREVVDPIILSEESEVILTKSISIKG